MEVLRPGELLADQGRAHDPALAFDQAAIGCMGKQCLRHARGQQGIGNARDHHHQQGGAHAGAQQT
jgi:hypothetical protein